MSRMTWLALALIASGAVQAQSLGFDGEPAGGAPAGWTCGDTGRGSPRWTVERDATAPSPPNILLQSGSGIFPWRVRAASSVVDGYVAVKFKAIKGREDQAGGLVWRWKDGGHYYVARANLLEGNVSPYYTERGNRRTLKYVEAFQDLAGIIRGADTSRLDLTPQSAGLHAISLGLSRVFADDHEMLRHGIFLYGALFAWCRDGRGEEHSWPPLM